VRNSVRKISASKKRGRYLSPTSLVVAMVVLAIGTVTVASRQRSSSSSDEKAAAAGRSSSVNLKASNQEQTTVDQNDQTQRTPEEAARLAAGLSQVIDQSTEGLVEVQHADGTVSMNLEDRFQNVTVVKVDTRGNLAQSCVDNPQAAGAFFRLNPELIESQRRVVRAKNQE